MRKLKYSILVVILLVGSLFFKGCQDLNVANTNEPTREAVLGDVNNTLKLLRGGFQDATGAAVSDWGVAMHHLSDQATATNAFRSYWPDFSGQPRRAINNTTAYSAEAAINTYWGSMNSSIATANQFIALIEQEGTEFVDNGDNLTKQIQSQAYFLRGFSRGYLGLIYDQAYMLEASTDGPPENPEFSDYTTVIDGAVSDIDRAITLANEFESDTGLNFTFASMPNTGDSWSKAEYVEILNSLAARFLAGKARTPSEAQNVDWNRVETYADNGLGGQNATSGLLDWTASNVGSSGAYANDLADWLNFAVTCGDGLSTCAGYNPTDVKQIHLLDPDYPVNYPVDQASSGEASLDPAQSDDPRLDYFVYTTNPGYLDVTRDPTLFTNYFSLRYFANNDWWPSSYGVTLITSVEVDMLKAEAQLMQDNPAGAATTLNNSTAGDGTISLSIDLPSVQLGFMGSNGMSGGHSLTGTESTERFQWALLREYSVELSLMGGTGLQWYFMRRHDLLQPGTPTMFPVPGQELELTGRDNYTYGGAGNAGSVGSAAGNNEWRELADKAFGSSAKIVNQEDEIYKANLDLDIEAPSKSTKGAVQK
ncbi:hypothetical protein [Fodinibius sp. SL11]|uniref:hypothetical protein n=1 Tax=Fodinibius sp. SL11 TaxID=3425690 RepID=UPI003F88091C